MSFKNHTSKASAKIFIEVTHAKLQKPHLNSVCKNTNIKVLVKAQEKHQLLPAKMCIFPKALCMWPHTKPPYKVLTWLNKDLSKSQFAAPRPWTRAEPSGYSAAATAVWTGLIWQQHYSRSARWGCVAITCLCCCPIHSWSLVLGSGVGQHQTPAPESDVESWKEVALHCTTHTYTFLISVRHWRLCKTHKRHELITQLDGAIQGQPTVHHYRYMEQVDSADSTTIKATHEA